jgi:hypothetical protein
MATKKVAKSVTYTLVPEAQYTQYYISKVKKNNLKSISENNETYQKNIDIVNKCRAVQISNESLIASQESDYQSNCVDQRRYSDCSDFRNEIDVNKKIAQEAMTSCTIDVAKVQKYNKEIIDASASLEKETENFQTSGTLENKQAELSAGVFIPPSTVYVRDNAPAHQLVLTTFHELLHASVWDVDATLPAFVNEGMTEMLNLELFGYDTYLTVAYSGYYAELQILNALLERIPLSEMLTVYISTDEKEFQKVFEKYFPEIEYEEFVRKGESIFASTFKVDGTSRDWDVYSIHDYMWLEDVNQIRLFLGLDEIFSYSEFKLK